MQTWFNQSVRALRCTQTQTFLNSKVAVAQRIEKQHFQSLNCRKLKSPLSVSWWTYIFYLYEKT